MSQKRYKPEQIIGKLREAEALLSQGSTVDEVCRKIEVTKQTYCRWRQEYGGLRVDQAHRLKQLDREDGRLKKLVADLSLDNQLESFPCARAILTSDRHQGLRGQACRQRLSGHHARTA